MGTPASGPETAVAAGKLLVKKLGHLTELGKIKADTLEHPVEVARAEAEERKRKAQAEAEARVREQRNRERMERRRRQQADAMKHDLGSPSFGEGRPSTTDGDVRAAGGQDARAGQPGKKRKVKKSVRWRDDHGENLEAKKFFLRNDA